MEGLKSRWREVFLGDWPTRGLREDSCALWGLDRQRTAVLHGLRAQEVATCAYGHPQQKEKDGAQERGGGGGGGASARPSSSDTLEVRPCRLSGRGLVDLEPHYIPLSTSSLSREGLPCTCEHTRRERDEGWASSNGPGLGQWGGRRLVWIRTMPASDPLDPFLSEGRVTLASFPYSLRTRLRLARTAKPHRQSRAGRLAAGVGPGGVRSPHQLLLDYLPCHVRPTSGSASARPSTWSATEWDCTSARSPPAERVPRGAWAFPRVRLLGG